MTTTALRKRVHQYVDKAEDNMLTAMYSLLRMYIDGDEESAMNTEQKAELDSRAKLFKQGKSKTADWNQRKAFARH